MLAPNLHFESLTQPLATTLRERFPHSLVVITAADIQRQPQVTPSSCLGYCGCKLYEVLKRPWGYPGKDPVPA